MCAGLWSCVKVEVAVLGSPSQIVFTVSVDVKQHCTKTIHGCSVALRAKSLSCVKVEAAVLGSRP